MKCGYPVLGLAFLLQQHAERMLRRGTRTWRGQDICRSVLGHGRIDFVRPAEDATLEIEDFAKASLAQEIDCFRGTLSAAAVRDYLARRVQLVDAPRQFAQWN